MATELGQAYVQIMPSAKGISGAISKQISPEANAAGDSAGKSIGSRMITAIKAAVAGAAIGKFFKASLMEGADLQQSIGGIETLFKDSYGKVKKYADEAYRTAGLSANAYMENVTGFSASLLQSMGGDTEKAADKANMAMVDMSDNANKMGTNMGDIQNAYQGFAKQNYTMLDNLKLGYGGTKEEMQRLLADATKLTGVKYDINNLADVYDAIHVIQGELGITGTTAKEAAETFSGSFAAMKASFSNFLGNLALGEDLGPSLNALAETTSTFLFENFFPMVGNIISALPGAIVTFIQAAAPNFMAGGTQMLTSIANGFTTGLPEFLTTFQTFMTSIVEWLTTNLPTFLQKGVEIVTNIANGILSALPQIITVVGNIIQTFVEWFIQNYPLILQKGVELIDNIVTGIANSLPKIGQSALDVIKKLVDYLIANLPMIVQSGIDILQKLVSTISSNAPKMAKAALDIMVQFINYIISKLPEIVSTGISIVGKLVSGIVQSIPQILGACADIATSIIGAISNINLWDAGKAIMSGFLDGLKSMWGGITSFVGGIADWIKEHKGPIEYDRKLLIPAGSAIMGGFNESLQTNFRTVQRTVSGMAGLISESFEGQSLGVAYESTLVSDARLNSDAFKSNNFNVADKETYKDNPKYVQVDFIVDGKNTVKYLYPYIEKEISKNEKKSSRLGGNR